MCKTLERLNITRAALEIDGSATLTAADDDQPDTELRQPRRDHELSAMWVRPGVVRRPDRT